MAGAGGAGTIDVLEIQIRHTASGAAAELNKVARAIRNIAAALERALPLLREFNALLGRRTLIFNDNRITNIADTINNGGKAAGRLAGGIRDVGNAARKTKGPLGNFLASLKRIAYYRFIRWILKSITQAFTEGLEKAYLFSSGIEGEGHRFAAALDEMKSHSNAMKGQIGSAFISLLAAIQPVLLAIIDLVTRAADAIAQFFAAFTGKGETYLKAYPTAAKWADAMSKGAGAAKEWKNQLLGFDEINRLNEPSQGGGGGGSNPLEGFGFEIADIDPKIRKFVKWIQDHMDLIKDIAIAIGAAIAAWMLGNTLTKLLGLTNALSTILGLAMAIGGAVLLILGSIDAINNGLDWENLLEMLAGALLYTVGLGIAFGVVGAAVGLLTSGLVFLIVGLYDFIKTGELTNQALVAIELGLLGIGVGLSLLTGSWIPLAVAAAVGAIVFVIARWDKLIDKCKEFQQKLSSSLGNGKLEWQDFAAVVARVIMWPIDRIAILIGWIETLIGWCRAAHAWIQDVLEGIGLLGFVRNTDNRAQQSMDNGSIWNGLNFATGGFPSEGELFVAREAGPEMVGTIGGRTAVANNDQIVEGIRQGVYEAVTAANGSGNNDVSVRVYLDSREIKAGQTRVNRAWGV